MVRREDIPWEELQRLNAQGWSYRRLAEKYGVSSSAIGRRAVLEGWHGTNDQRANARLRNLAARLRRQPGLGVRRRQFRRHGADRQDADEHHQHQYQGQQPLRHSRLFHRSTSFLFFSFRSPAVLRRFPIA